MTGSIAWTGTSGDHAALRHLRPQTETGEPPASYQVSSLLRVHRCRQPCAGRAGSAAPARHQGRADQPPLAPARPALAGIAADRRDRRAGRRHLAGRPPRDPARRLPAERPRRRRRPRPPPQQGRPLAARRRRGATASSASSPATCDALAAYDPFHLICATVDSVTALTWDRAVDPARDPPCAPPSATSPPARTCSPTPATPTRWNPVTPPPSRRPLTSPTSSPPPARPPTRRFPSPRPGATGSPWRPATASTRPTRRPSSSAMTCPTAGSTAPPR